MFVFSHIFYLSFNEIHLTLLIQVIRSRYLYEGNTVKDTKYILSFNVNEQLMIMVHTTHKVKERARLYLQRCFVNVTRPDKWSHNTVNKY